MSGDSNVKLKIMNLIKSFVSDTIINNNSLGV